MNELIKLQPQTINGNAVETVPARELYERLGLDKSNWSCWSKSSIVCNPFALENVDYGGSPLWRTVTEWLNRQATNMTKNFGD